MNPGDKCKILKIYVSDDSRYKGHNLYQSVLFKLREMGIAGVTVTRGIEGYGQGRALQSAHILSLSAGLPVIIEAVDTTEQIEKAIPAVEEIVNEGLIMVTDVTVIKYGKTTARDQE